MYNRCTDYKDVITRHEAVLSRIIEPCFGLLFELTQKGVLSDCQFYAIRKMQSPTKRCIAALHVLRDATDISHFDQFFDQLAVHHQLHVINFLKSGGGRTWTFLIWLHMFIIGYPVMLGLYFTIIVLFNAIHFVYWRRGYFIK